jgi:hypothetical protein
MGFASIGTNTYAGGLMVCDDRGFPVEFRYSEPITPTRVQQVLYGNVLDKYVKIDVIAESLIKAVTSPFNLLIVQDEVILEHKFQSQLVVIRISLTKSPPLTARGEFIKIKEKEYLVQTSANSNPVRVQFSSAYKIDESEIKTTLQTIGEAGASMDLDEPISRVYRALDLICQQTQAKQDSGGS